MDYSALPLPKVSKHVQTKAMRDALRKRIDRLESAKVKERSEGRCEIRVREGQGVYRCPLASVPGVHHMLSGYGVRARGPSLLSEHKQDVCQICHDAITTKKLRRVGGEAPHWTDHYVRSK